MDQAEVREGAQWYLMREPLQVPLARCFRRQESLGRHPYEQGDVWCQDQHNGLCSYAKSRTTVEVERGYRAAPTSLIRHQTVP